MRPGELDQQVELQSPSFADDGDGGTTKTFAVQDTVWARVRPLRGSEREHSDMLQAAGGYMVIIRNRNDVDETWRLRWVDRDRTFNIRFVPDPGPRSLYLMLECERGVAT